MAYPDSLRRERTPGPVSCITGQNPSAAFLDKDDLHHILTLETLFLNIASDNH